MFCPDEYNFHITIDNLINLFDLVKISDIKSISLHFILLGWVKKDEYKNIISKLIQNNSYLFITHYIFYWPLNYGKYYLFNKIKQITNLLDNYYIFYSDHDIVFPLPTFPKNFFTIGISVFDNDPKIGLIALNQIDDIRHQNDIYQNNIEINNIHLIYPNDCNFGSIADGCFIVRSHAFHLIESFHLYNVYGLDDYYLVKKLYDKNYKSLVFMNIFIKHPFYYNIEYSNWKKKQILDMITGENINYYLKIQESMNFWNSFM